MAMLCCSARPKSVAEFVYVAPAPISSPHATLVEGIYEAPDGTMLSRRSWTPINATQAARCIVLIHGLAEHSARYHEMGEFFAKAGCVVHAYDQRGHGKSGGFKNFVSNFDEYIEDGMAFLHLVRSEHPEMSHVLIGHSMGGLVAARMLAMRAPNVTCAVLSGPALSIPPGGAAQDAKIAVVKTLASVLPKLTVDTAISLDGLASDPEVGRMCVPLRRPRNLISVALVLYTYSALSDRVAPGTHCHLDTQFAVDSLCGPCSYDADPLIDTNITLSLADTLLRAQADVDSGLCDAATITVPVLGLHGADDPICTPAATEAFLSRVVTKGSRAKLYPGLRHEIFNEPSKRDVWAHILDFVQDVEQAATKQ